MEPPPAGEVPVAFVGAGPGTYLRRTVTLGERIDDRMEILAGLAAGDRLVTEGGLFLQFAQGQ